MSTGVFVGYDKECGCLLAAVVDKLSCAWDVMEMVRLGYRVEIVDGPVTIGGHVCKEAKG